MDTLPLRSACLGSGPRIVEHGYKHVFSQNARAPFAANISLDGLDREMSNLPAEMYHIDGCSQAAASLIERYPMCRSSFTSPRLFLAIVPVPFGRDMIWAKSNLAPEIVILRYDWKVFVTPFDGLARMRVASPRSVVVPPKVCLT